MIFEAFVVGEDTGGTREAAYGKRKLHPFDEDEARILAQSIVETIRQPLLILNEDLRVRFANPAFYEVFQVDRTDAEGRLVYELGNRQWDIPRLRELLSERLPQDGAVEQFEIEHTFRRENSAAQRPDNAACR